MDVRNLTALQLDALREVGNVGAGNAATSLSQMVNRTVDMNVPNLGVVPFNEVADRIGGPDSLVVGVFLQIEGEAPGNLLFVLNLDSAKILVEMLMGMESGSMETLDEMAASALQEIGNIIAGTYLNALSMFTGITFDQSVPALAVDMAGAILSVILTNIAAIGDHVLLLETQFVGDGNEIAGQLFFIPEEGSLERILGSLGLV